MFEPWTYSELKNDFKFTNMYNLAKKGQYVNSRILFENLEIYGCVNISGLTTL